MLEAGVALDGAGVGVDGEDLVAALARALLHDVAAVAFWRAGDAGHRDTLFIQELGGCLFDRVHSRPLCYG